MRIVASLGGWVGKDVCRCLEIVNHSHALKRLDEDERRDGVVLNDPIGRQQNAVCINEQGLYRLIFTSRKDAAEKFKRWLAHEVLPALRRTGRYEMPRAPEYVLTDPNDEELWLRKVNTARRTFGWSAAQEVWEMSSLPQVSHMARKEETEAEGLACLQWLLDFRIGGEISYGELIEHSRVREGPSQRLVHLGVRVDLESYAHSVVVADLHPAIMGAFAGSRWAKGWRRALLAIPGSEAVAKARYRRLDTGAVAVPQSVVRELMGKE